VEGQAPADGYPLMFTNSTTWFQNKMLFSRNCPTIPTRTSTLVAWFNTGHLDHHQQGRPAKNTREVRPAWAAGPQVSLGPPMRGSYAHVVAETLNRHYDLKMEAVHYRGEALCAGRGLRRVQGASGSLRFGQLQCCSRARAGRSRCRRWKRMKMKKMPTSRTHLRDGSS